MIRTRSIVLGALGACLLLAGCEKPVMQTAQIGFRGTGMEQVTNPRLAAKSRAANSVPEALPVAPADGPRAKEVYQNVQVLGDLGVVEFNRVMAAITSWVAPQQGCAYCHAGADLAADTVYTKVVARRMLQMTRHLNTDWQTHVKGTGVTCYTCHRGQPVPAQVWFTQPEVGAAGFAARQQFQNRPAKSVGLTTLPYDPFTKYLLQPVAVRVQSQVALPSGSPHNIKETEAVYGMMVHMTESLGVNCDHCHNSRAFADWSQSTPQRAQAWYGIRMVRDLNVAFMQPLQGTFPKNRLGPLGDVAKVNCATCHQGVNKPLYGVSMAKDYPELGAPRAAPAPAEAAPAAARAAPAKS